MWTIVVIIVGLLIAAQELPDLLRNKRRVDIGLFSTLLLIGIALGVMESLELDIPNPLDALTVIFGPVSELMKSIFI
ncbi:hypothetical protein [Paenibacillus sp. PL2-23]|uniref:hypothetical protein n=1 Tax=Paenibacillus sp. PL2-23 TaxID=2100729 RepID=UPI0030F6CAA6